MTKFSEIGFLLIVEQHSNGCRRMQTRGFATRPKLLATSFEKVISCSIYVRPALAQVCF